MVSRWTCLLYTSLIFVCVRVSSAVYLLCFLDICRIGSVLVRVSQLWCSWLHGVLKNRLRSRTRVAITMINYLLEARLRVCIQRGVFVMFSQYLKNRLRFRTRMQNVRSHVVRETVRSESNRPRVLRDQKALPDVRNRSLLLREFFSFSIFKKLVWIQ